MPAPRKSLFSSLASTESHPRLPDALLEWTRLSPLVVASSRHVTALPHLMDGIALSQILMEVDEHHFAPLKPALSNEKPMQENWVLRFNHLKRLYKLAIRYFEDVLSCSTTELHTPNLQIVAKKQLPEANDEVCKLVGLVLALAVQSDRRLEQIERIQALDEWVQKELMYSIEQSAQVMSKVEQIHDADREKTLDLDADSEFYQVQSEKSRLVHDKEALQVIHEDLVEQFDALKEQHEEALEHAAASEARAVAAEQKLEADKKERNEQSYKLELDRMRNELHKLEHQLGESQVVVEKQARSLEDLTKQVDQLTPLAREATTLKDQMDEYKHASDKAQKLQHVLDKYKKKVEDAASLKQRVQTLEEENLDLLDKHSTFEDRIAKVDNLEHLVEKYKARIETLERQESSTIEDHRQLEAQHEQVRAQLEAVEIERTQERERCLVLEERIREFELADKSNQKRSTGRDEDGEPEEDEMGTELEDALRGTTTKDLKLKIRKLERQLKGQGQVEQLEASLHEANKSKERYRQARLDEAKAKDKLEQRLNEILRGRSELGDGPQVAVALRDRLDEITRQLERAHSQLNETEARFEAQQRELSIAKSDLDLVDQDQLEQLRALRASVSVDRDKLALRLEQARDALGIADEQARDRKFEIEQLLRDKVELQTRGIQQTDQLLERERQLGSSIDPEDAQADRTRFDHEFIKSQDKLLKAELSAGFEETIESHEARISQLQEDLSRQQAMFTELELNYRREHDLIMSAWHDHAMRHLRQQVLTSANDRTGTGASKSGEREYQPQSWIKQQRLRANGPSLYCQLIDTKKDPRTPLLEHYNFWVTLLNRTNAKYKAERIYRLSVQDQQLTLPPTTTKTTTVASNGKEIELETEFEPLDPYEDAVPGDMSIDLFILTLDDRLKRIAIVHRNSFKRPVDVYNLLASRFPGPQPLPSSNRRGKTPRARPSIPIPWQNHTGQDPPGLVKAIFQKTPQERIGDALPRDVMRDLFIHGLPPAMRTEVVKSGYNWKAADEMVPFLQDVQDRQRAEQGLEPLRGE
ncbi:uncharacterized protein JCM15063_005292 [Sporobolomyces koalae]|uniref:uncharacterized protein n=1 Tax=Sporobolomyces koalae TaxID=500713 RepID=UPI00317B5F8E